MCLWIFPFVRQYKTDLFWYFLVLGLTDPFAFIFYSINPKIPIIFISNFLMLLSLVYRMESKKAAFVFIIFNFALLSIYVSRPQSPYYFNFLLIHSVIIYLFIKRAIMFSAANRKLNLFHIFLLLEEISAVLKAIFVSFYNVQALPFFYITLIFEYFLALFFSFYREEDERIYIKLRVH